ncbi:hypothetical protein, partial [Klebsiella pneumoniae]|uniref:hypothetical protein n=1 Tax=Klebsiella pneumoniae TaxID=573 RepID=UPI001C57BFF4
TALREHHVVLDGSLYGIGSGQQDSELYKAMYERDFAGHRFAGKMNIERDAHAVLQRLAEGLRNNHPANLLRAWGSRAGVGLN